MKIIAEINEIESIKILKWSIKLSLILKKVKKKTNKFLTRPTKKEKKDSNIKL